MSSSRPDQIRIESLSLHLPTGLGPSAFSLIPPPPCPVNITLTLSIDSAIIPRFQHDDSFTPLSINYSSVSKSIYALVNSRNWADVGELIEGIRDTILEVEGVDGVRVEVELPRASLVGNVWYVAEFGRRASEKGSDKGKGKEKEIDDGEVWKCRIEGMKPLVLIGLHPHERTAKQPLEVDIILSGRKDGVIGIHNALSRDAHKYLEESQFYTIEALIDSFAKYILSTLPEDIQFHNETELQVTIRKPAALPFAVPGITIHRTPSSYGLKPAIVSSSTTGGMSDGSGGVYLALGSNIGDRIGHIRNAVKGLESRGVKVKRTSRLYESEAMYVEDQDRFINGAIEVDTDLNPLGLLNVLKDVEKEVGRVKTFSNGPRVIDLDIVFYKGQVVKIGSASDGGDAGEVRWLQVPHRSLGEREFVLRPLSDLVPNLIHPVTHQTISTLLQSISGPSQISPIIPFPHPSKPLRLDQTLIMQIFNSTPDSFSDGQPDLSLSTSLSQINALYHPDIFYPPQILDIGGMSTRPNSTPCTEEEELSRVIPLIQAIRLEDEERVRDVVISVDTYRPGVARAAVEAGAGCINDVRGGSEEGMLEVMAEMGVPVVIMHSRGDSTTMGSKEMQDYTSQGGVVRGVIGELRERVERALKAGVREWDIVIDPGLGFAKDAEGNIELLRGIGEIKRDEVLGKFAMLVGGSRKGFVGKVTGRKEAKERGWGDAAVVGWCVKEVVEIVRVHEGRGMGEVVKMWQGIMAGGQSSP